MFDYPELVFAISVVIIGIVAGVVDFFKHRHDKDGWIYFIGSDDPETPIKVGMSKYEPAADRLGDIQTMSPVALRVLYKMHVPNRLAAEQTLHAELAAHRLHGEWFNRDAALAVIDHLKGRH